MLDALDGQKSFNQKEIIVSSSRGNPFFHRMVAVSCLLQGPLVNMAAALDGRLVKKASFHLVDGLRKMAAQKGWKEAK